MKHSQDVSMDEIIFKKIDLLCCNYPFDKKNLWTWLKFAKILGNIYKNVKNLKTDFYYDKLFKHTLNAFIIRISIKCE